MSGTPNALSEMKNLDHVVVTKDERPNPSFKQSALPGFKKTVQGRRAIRIFDGEPLPEEVMRDCLRDATLAPSSSNLQCYELYWVRDDEKKKQMAALCLGQPGAETAGDIVVVVSRVDDWKSHHAKLTRIMTDDGKKPMKGPVLDYYENVVPMLMKTDRWGFNNLKRRLMFWYRRRTEPTPNGPVRRADHRVYGTLQASLAAENLMLSIAAHGYESCPMGGIDKRGIGALLGLPETAEVVMVIGVGTGKPEGLFSARVRLPFHDLVKEV
ncbi:nitroreductase family protein [Alisedimentitalea sp. MJ-SS2]|uniref:nitroreductase family protein n=1 Tax=Aliisedimentitalea sp. MJ-SS2 TaxID=3049795 RepID=UPI002911A2C7|nr:nitroreductase family protein [Alisedimentitalea sp. MJ-SS2]MDU8926273.1 nitroreductase family protein [Alisedimentitalea sp. MJ-SS2]